MAIEKFKTYLQELRFSQSKLSELHLKDLKVANEFIQEIVKQKQTQLADELLQKLHQNSPDFHFYYYCKLILACLQKQPAEPFLKKLLLQLNKENKSHLIEHVANEVLQYQESRIALETLIQIADKSGLHDKKLLLLKRLLNTNKNDWQLVKKIAEIEEKKNLPEAIKYYKLIFQILVEKNAYLDALIFWKKLSIIAPQEIDFLFSWIKRISSHIEKNKLENAFMILIRNEEKKTSPNWHVVVLAVKTAFENGLHFHSQLAVLQHAFSEIFKNHTYLHDFFNLSGLAKLIRNRKDEKSPQVALQCIQNFEKQIRFDSNTVVRHRYFGLGIIRSIKRPLATTDQAAEATYLLIDFEKKSSHKMSLRIALNSLALPSNNHLLALKYFNPELLQQILTGDEVNLARSILETLEKPVLQKDIHQFMSPTFFSNEEWTQRWPHIKKILQKDQEFEYFNKYYRLRISIESVNEKTLKELNRTTQPKEKIRIIESYFLHNTHPDEKLVEQIVKQILHIIDENSNESLRFVVFLKHLADANKIKIEYDFKQNFLLLFSKENFYDTLKRTHNQSMRLLFLRLLEQFLEQKFDAEIESLLLTHEFEHQEVVLDFLLHKKKIDLLQRIFNHLKENYISAPGKFFWMAKAIMNNSVDFQNVAYDEVLLKSVKLLGEINKNINLEKNVSASRKIFTSLHQLLFNNGLLFEWLKKPVDAKLMRSEEKEQIFNELEKQTFLENYLKVEIRTLHEQYR